MTFRLFLILVTSLMASPRVIAADYSTPAGRVQDLTGRTLTIISDTPQNRNFRWSRMEALVYDAFDFRSMSDGMLSTQWRRVNEDERRRYTDFFSQYLEATYFPVTESRIIDTELLSAELATVSTVSLTASQQIQVQYKLKNNNGSWFAFDVVVDGVSLIENYHITYNAIISNEGIEALASDIQRRIHRYRGETGNIADDS